MQSASKEFISRPYLIEAWQLHPDNLDLVGQWCRGRVRGLSIVFPKIRDKSKPIEGQDNNHYAVVGDWVVKTSAGFVKMKNDEFNKRYAPTQDRISA